jgi:elongation factor G
MAGRIGEIHRILSFTIKLRDGNDRKSLQAELEEIIQQVPSKRAEVISTADGLLVSGEDELELLSLRSKALFDSHAEVGNLKINFRETIRKSGAAEGKYIRQTGGMGNYGHCKLRVEPNLPGNGNEFVEDIRVGAVPSKYIEPIHQGVQDALERGIIAGYPIIDVKVTLYDGSYHEADSNEMAFKFAGSIAFKEAARKASPVILEPVMAAEAMVQEEQMGAIIADINSRRGRIEGIERLHGSQMIHAIVPLAEVLTSSTHGRPTYELNFAGYEAASPRQGPFGDDAATLANKPLSPKPRAGSAAAEPDD